MKRTLQDWLQIAIPELVDRGFRVSEISEHRGTSFSVDVEGTEIMGRLTYWPDDQFEFQFHSAKSGDVVLLESPNLTNTLELQDYFLTILGKLGSNIT